jgi:hypothetical protein
MPKAALGSDISNTAFEEERGFNKILEIQVQAFITSVTAEKRLKRVLTCLEKVEDSNGKSTQVDR